MLKKYTESAYNPLVIVSIYTGLMLTDTFDDIHEGMEAISDGPLFTHQLVQVLPFFKDLLKQEFPQLEDLNLPDIDPENWEEVKPAVYDEIKRLFPNDSYYLPVHTLVELIDES